MLAAAVMLVAGLALLAATRRPADRRRPIGWACTGASLVVAIMVEGWLGLAAWLGLVPIAAGGILLHRSYRPSRVYALAVGIALLLAIGWLDRYR